MPQTPNAPQAEVITLTLTGMANGGKAVGRDDHDRAVFVPLAIPGERVRAEVVDAKTRFAHANLVEVLQPSTQRVEARCPHFGLCGGCHFQHIHYEAQLQYKEAVIRDQLKRIGGITGEKVNPTMANPEPWSYSSEVSFYRTPDGGLGFWSPSSKQVFPVEICYIIRPELLELYQEIELSLPTLRRIKLRVDDAGELMASLEVDGDEIPSINTESTISVALILPDGTTTNLIGSNHSIFMIKDRPFRVTAGYFFYPSPEAIELAVDAVLGYSELSKSDRVVEFNSGVGTLTAFLAHSCHEVIGIEPDPEAVADLSVNLVESDNVSLYQGTAEEILPKLDVTAQVMIIHPYPSGLTPAVIDEVARLHPRRLVYVSSDVATLARDGRRLSEKGYRLLEIQPIDMWPQTYFTLTVSLWERAG